MLKIIQAKLQKYMSYELPDVQAGFRKGRGTRHQIANICLIIEKAGNFQKTSTSALWLRQSLWMCRSQQTVENSLRDGNTRPLDLPLEKPVCRSGSNSLNWTWNNRLVPNRKGVHQAVYCHPAYLTYMQSTSWEKLDWRKHKLESRLLGEYQ